MNQSYQNNFTSQRNYQKTSSLTNFQLDDIDNSPKSPKPSFLSSSTSQLNNKEAEFMMIEDGLSRHFNYIQKNLNRIPNFSSSEKAKEELKRLLEQLNQMENATVPSEHPNIESRLSEISKQHQTLNNEEQVISKLRSTNDDDKARDDAEYESIKNKIKDNKYEFQSLLWILLKISNNHHRTSMFFDKIERILEYLKDVLQKYSNFELFHFFASNKRILLFLIEAKIMIIDELQCDYTIAKHPLYFQPEIQPFIDKEWFSKYDEEEFDTDWILEIKKEIPNNFYERRKIGENEKYICEIIRKDSIEDFIVYMNKNNYQFNSLIKSSI